ncbi:MAG: DUF6152 family protein [Gammaproteobacteria bacterium]
MRYTAAFVVGIVLALPLSAHHSDAGMDMESVVAFEGTVTEFNWRNPHVYFTVETTDQNGEPVEWTLQTDSTNLRARGGWTLDSLASGDRVLVRGNPAEDGRPYAILVSIDKEGVELPMNTEAAGVTASTSTLEGIWRADSSKLISYPGGFDGFFIAQLNLTEKGRAAEAQFGALSAENPDSTCIGRPTPAALVSTAFYPLEIEINEDEETIVLRSELFDEARTVYMDGRGHPENGERTVQGHSIGSWEGDILVVDTRNFADHRSPYQTGVPSGAQKHVVERYQLTEDGTRVVVSFLLEDPEFIAEPMTHTRELIYSPHMEMLRFDCDAEATRRFVTQ